MERTDGRKTPEQWVEHFKDIRGMGAVIVEGPCIAAVVDYIAYLESEIDRWAEWFQEVYPCLRNTKFTQ